MEEYIKELKSLFDEMNRLRFQEGNYYPLKQRCLKMLSIIDEMQKEAIQEDKQTYLTAYTQLSHTTHKEVEYVKYYQDKMSKKNAAKVRAKEYYKALDEAVAQIHMDISSII